VSVAVAMCWRAQATRASNRRRMDLEKEAGFMEKLLIRL
jgi:hypothetical protein